VNKIHVFLHLLNGFRFRVVLQLLNWSCQRWTCPMGNEGMLMLLTV